MASSRLFYFGIEIELLLGSKKKTHSTWKSLADGIELVSPVYPSDWTWAADLEVIFDVIHSSFVMAESGHCSTHVHVSTYPPMEVDELATLGKAILYFEPALDTLVPKARRGSAAYWCQSNRANPVLKRCRTLAECFLAVDDAAGGSSASAMLSSSPSSSSSSSSSSSGGCEGVVAALNMFPASSAYGRAHRKKHDFVRGKVYKWDLTGLCSPRGTVEFRQPPGSLNAAQAGGWATIALAFVEGSVRGDTPWFAEGDGADFEAGAPVERLWDVLCDGAAGLGLEVDAIAGVFAARK